MRLTVINPGPCRNCGDELELKAVIARVAEVPETRYFQCKNCDHIEVVECQKTG